MDTLAQPARWASWPTVLVVLVLGISVLLPGTREASAAWRLSGSGPGDAKAASVPAPAGAPAAAKSMVSATATISWTATPVGSRSATGYVVRRYSGTTLSPMTAGTCVGTTVNGVDNVVATTSCTDERGLSGGTFTYTLQPVYERWLGPTSPASTPAV